MIKASINGFGRIGRTAMRVYLSRPDLREALDIAAINTSGSMNLEGWAMLLKHDTTYRGLPNEFAWEETRPASEATDADPEIGVFIIDGKRIPVTAQRDPAKLPWKEYGVELVLECTGVFLSEDKAKAHLEAGARRVLLSAPAKGGGVETHLLGVSKHAPSGAIVSNASCTTNCVAPVMEVLHEALGVKKASLTTVHAYTDGQNIQDGSHKKDMYRARAAAENLAPTSTGAAKAVTQVIPALDGLFDGLAIRTPTVTGSISDIVALTSRETTIAEVNEIFTRAAASNAMRGVLGVTEEPLVSSDIIGSSYSCIVALPFTNVIDGDLVKVLAWYDNEWGYCSRLVELATKLD